MSPRRRPKDLSRRTATRPERRTIVVFCEGKVSEPGYIRAWKQLTEVRSIAAVEIEVDTAHDVPLQLVELAVARAADTEVDEVWCVFDVEWPRRHPNLLRAVQLAQRRGIRLAISNPCFELWLVLHHQDWSKAVTTAEAVRRSGVAKNFDPAPFLPLRGDAARRADALAGRHASNGSVFPDDNPSSSFGNLLRAVEGRADG